MTHFCLAVDLVTRGERFLAGLAYDVEEVRAVVDGDPYADGFEVFSNLDCDPVRFLVGTSADVAVCVVQPRSVCSAHELVDGRPVGGVSFGASAIQFGHCSEVVEACRPVASGWFHPGRSGCDGAVCGWLWALS